MRFCTASSGVLGEEERIIFPPFSPFSSSLFALSLFFFFFFFLGAALLSRITALALSPLLSSCATPLSLRFLLSLCSLQVVFSSQIFLFLLVSPTNSPHHLLPWPFRCPLRLLASPTWPPHAGTWISRTRQCPPSAIPLLLPLSILLFLCCLFCIFVIIDFCGVLTPCSYMVLSSSGVIYNWSSFLLVDKS